MNQLYCRSLRSYCKLNRDFLRFFSNSLFNRIAANNRVIRIVAVKWFKRSLVQNSNWVERLIPTLEKYIWETVHISVTVCHTGYRWLPYIFEVRSNFFVYDIFISTSTYHLGSESLKALVIPAGMRSSSYLCCVCHIDSCLIFLSLELIAFM